MVSYMDFSIGRIVNQLDELGLRENTIILFTGDNGTDEPVVSMMDNVAVVEKEIPLIMEHMSH